MKKFIRRWLLGTDDLGRILATEAQMESILRQIELIKESLHYQEVQSRKSKDASEVSLETLKRIEQSLYRISRKGFSLAPEDHAKLRDVVREMRAIYRSLSASALRAGGATKPQPTPSEPKDA